MKHFALPGFWRRYHQLPKDVRELADKSYKLLGTDPQHPSLQLKKVGTTKQLWSVRVGMHYRAWGLDKPEGIAWFWIGSHAQYDKLLS
jgi:hypothetical protein